MAPARQFSRLFFSALGMDGRARLDAPRSWERGRTRASPRGSPGGHGRPDDSRVGADTPTDASAFPRPTTASPHSLEASKPRPVSKSNDDAFNFWFWQLSHSFIPPSRASSLTATHFSTCTARAPGHRPTHGVNPPRVRPSTWTRRTTNSTTRGADHPRRRRREEKEDNRDRRPATRAAARTDSDSAWRRLPDSRAGPWPTCSATTTARRGRRAARPSARRRRARRATIAAAAADPGPAAPGRGALG